MTIIEAFGDTVRRAQSSRRSAPALVAFRHALAVARRWIGNLLDGSLIEQKEC